MANKTEQEEVRCAIYTRKSTDEGLEQDFNSLDAQRMAGENYIASQQGEGWVCLDEHYDDGGFTGGNMERPALRRLLADVEAGRVDCIVVYKVDRLSRSLLDFAKILGVLEQKGVSFVSVTQNFNSATSMGRLTLNILLSFAQFEREVISERTRDKIAMARKQGKWSGGRPVLGYDLAPEGGRLVVNPAEAEQVRTIFELYLQHRSVLDVIEELDRRGWTNKTWVTKKGNVRPGKPFDKNAIYSLLRNPVYIGKIRHRENIYEGEHEGIVDGALYKRVQEDLGSHRHAGKTLRINRMQFGGILKGILRCKACDCGMSHSFSKKGNTRYRYYVCQNAQNRGWSNCPRPSLPADEIEKFVVQEIRTICQDEVLIREIVQESRSRQKVEIADLQKNHRLMKKELVKLERELESLAPISIQLHVAGRTAGLREQIRQTKLKIADLEIRMRKAKSTILDEQELSRACQTFDPLWDTLNLREQWRILRLLLERVEFDAADSSISMSFFSAGIKDLNEKLPERKAVSA